MERKKIDALSVLGSVSFSPQMPFHCIIASQLLPMVKIQFVCFEHIISIAISTHKRSVVDDTEATAATASAISTTKSTYHPSEFKRKQNQQHLHLKLLPHPFYFNSFHFISFRCVSFHFFVQVFIAYFSIFGLTFPHSLLTLLHSYILNLRFNIMLCTFSLVLYYTYSLFFSCTDDFLHFKPQPPLFKREKKITISCLLHSLSLYLKK